MNLLEIQPKAHTKTEIAQQVAKWCNNPDTPDLLKWIFIKELEIAVKDAQERLRADAKKSYLELSEGSLDKKHLFGVEVSTQSTLKKQTLAKTYLYSDAVDKIEKEIDELEKRLTDKKEVLKAMKMMEINNGTATEVTPDTIIGDEVATELPVEDTFNLVIKFDK